MNIDTTGGTLCKNTRYYRLLSVPTRADVFYTPVNLKRYAKEDRIRKLNEMFGSRTKCGYEFCNPNTAT